MPLPSESAGGEEDVGGASRGGHRGAEIAAARQQESNVLVFVRHPVMNLNALHARKIVNQSDPSNDQ